MTTLIKLKKSSVVGRVPGTGDLDYGELALNFADGKLYFKNSSNAIKAFGDSAQTETLFDAKFDTKTTSDLTEGSNLYYTLARADSDAKNAISVTDAGGDGSLSYDNSTGVITYTGPSASEVRAHFTAGSNINIVDGKIALDSAVDVPLTYVDLRPGDPIAYSEGRLFYHEEYKALTVYNDIDSVALQVGFEEWIRVYNNTGSTIVNGTPVYKTGAVGETATVAPADATTEAKALVLGVATHNIADASEGVVTVRGLVSGFDTSHLTAGQPIHLAPDGSIQNSAPTYPYFPVDLGSCIVSDSSNGYLYIRIENHTYEQFRVTGNQHIGGDLTVNGDLTVTGTQSIVSQANLAVDNSFIYTNSGDTIGTDNTNFTGSGLNDAILVGHYNGTASSKTFYVRIDGVGTGTGGVDTFEWALDSDFASPIATDVDITGSNQTLVDGISIDFNATTGHTLNDRWYGTASPVNIDAGFASNRNTGTTGVGYTHMGMFFDVTDEKWKLFKSYYPEPEGTINTTDSSYEKATLDANLTGNVTGNVTGDVTGTASNATALDTLTSGQFLRSDAADTKTSGDLSFSDNIKAIFGTGSDLQIYHDGSHSYVTDQGTGDLRLNGTNVSLNNAANNKTYLYATDGGSVQLRYNDLTKLATASTGVDVTGTAKADTVQLATTGILEDAVVNTSSTSQTAIVSYSATTYGGGKVLIEAKSGVNRHITELLVTHDGTTAIATEYGTIATSGNLATYDVDISGGNLRVLATPASGASTTFRVIHQTMFA